MFNLHYKRFCVAMFSNEFYALEIKYQQMYGTVNMNKKYYIVLICSTDLDCFHSNVVTVFGA